MVLHVCHLQINADTDEVYLYRDLAGLVRRLGSGLVRAGLSKGDVVCIFSTNVPMFAIATLAIIGAGGIMTACNPYYTKGKS